MIRELGEHAPEVAPTAWVSESAYVVGNVVLGDRSSVWPGAVIRGDFGKLTIGSNSHIEDNCVVHSGEDLDIGDHVIVGHGVVVHCRRVGSCCLIGNNATLLDGAVIGDECLVAAGAVVLGPQEIPNGSFVSGVPAKVVPASPEQVGRLRQLASSRGGGYADLAQRYRAAGL